MANWISNGKSIERVSISDRGFQYGDGLFETIAIRNGEPRLWSYHLDRLARGCKRLGIRLPSETVLSDGVMQSISNDNVPPAFAVAKIIVSAGVGQRGYGRPFCDTPTVLFGAFAAEPLPQSAYRDGIDTVICRTRLATDSPTAGLKTLNRMEQVLARSEIADPDIFEGLTMDAADNIICGTMSNVFFIHDNTVSTPPLDRCGVEGVMRRHVIEMLSRRGITTSIRPLAKANLDSIDEVFLSNSQFGVLPVRSCVQKTWQVGETTRQVMSVIANSDLFERRL
jgi:4-amino-4-deoxychorismate lyase